MVRIVDPNPQPEVEKEINCGRCGVKLAYVPNDIQRGESMGYTGSKYYYNYISCPACNKSTEV